MRVLVPYLSSKQASLSNTNEKLCARSGGIQINGLGATDIDNQAEFQNSTTLGGINLELHQRISKHYGRLDKLNHAVANKIKNPELWRFEARVAEMVIADWIAEHPEIFVIKVRVVKQNNTTDKIRGTLITFSSRRW